MSQGGYNKYVLKWGTNVMTEAIAIQHANIHKLFYSLRSFKYQLGIIDADAFLKLRYLIDVKKSSLQHLLDSLRYGNLPLYGPSEQEIKGHLDQLNISQIKDQDSSIRSIFAHDTGRAYRENDISIYGKWDKDVYDVVKKYLEERNPREQLKYIYRVATQLRDALEKHFTISDILLEVGDNRLLGKTW